MKKILFLMAHPHLSQSRANRCIIESVQDVPNLEILRLYDVYPYFHIDIPKEQARLEQADLIVVQYPLYWFNMPALLKQWMDEVFEYNWAFGPEGTKLQGKDLLVSVTSGGPMETPLTAWEQIAQTCGMKLHTPLILPFITDSPDETLCKYAEQVRTQLMTYSEEGRLP